jgi:hypothetical protein
MRYSLIIAKLIACGLFLSAPHAGKSAEIQPVVAVYTYADVADLSLGSELAIHAKVRSAKKLKKSMAQGVAVGFERFLVTSDVVTLIRGKQGVDPRISYIIDLPVDARGRTEKLVKREFILFANTGRPGEIRLIARDAQIPATPEAGAMVRRILTESLAPAAPPRVTGVDAAFYSEGSLTGQGETQIFLQAEGNRPVSISVIREPEQAVSWRIAVGDAVDEGAGPPKRNSFLWYRLACFIPATPPPALFNELSEAAITAIKRDYAAVVEGLGQCRRARITA